MTEIFILLLIIYNLNRLRICPLKFQTLYHTPLLKKREMIHFSEYAWTRNIQEIITINFSKKELYYNIHENNIYTDKVDFITICIECLSRFRFKILQRSLTVSLLIKLNLYREIKTFNGKSNKLALVVHKHHLEMEEKYLSNEKFKKTVVKIFSKATVFNHQSLSLTNCGRELCLRFLMNRDLRREDINIEKILDEYGRDFLELYEMLESLERS